MSKEKLNKNGIHKKNQKLLDRYTLHCRNKGLTKKSIKAICDNDIRLFMQFIGEKKLKNVTHDDVEMFMLYCLQERGNGSESLNRKFTSLNQFFNTLIKQEIKGIERNPLDKLEKPKVRKKVREHLTYEEYLQVMKYIDDKGDLRGGALFAVFFSSACRVSEIHQLNRGCFDFKARRFKTLGKGEKERTCMLSEDAADRIQRYLDSRTDDLEPLFISRENNRWSVKAMQNYTKNTCWAAGISKKVTPHILRHGRAMYLLKQKLPLQVIQKLLGHESIATTQIYAKQDFDDAQAQIDKIDIA